jgi:ABC-type phosphate/phosphonate transport system permease subunit
MWWPAEALVVEIIETVQKDVQETLLLLGIDHEQQLCPAASPTCRPDLVEQERRLVGDGDPR